MASGSKEDRSISEIVRECVREELQVQRGVSNSTLLMRTRNLIADSARSASRDVANSVTINSSSVPSTSGVNSTSLPSTSGLVSSSPSTSSFRARASSYGHSWRFKKGKQKMPPKQEFSPKAIHLLDMYMASDHDEYCDDENFIPDYPVKEEYILLKGYFELGTAQTEKEIRNSICEVIKQRFPYIESHHFDFVKRDRNKITTPVVSKTLMWDYKHIKELCGQGKLYVRLNTPKECIEKVTVTSDASDDEESKCDEELMRPALSAKPAKRLCTSVAAVPINDDTMENPSTTEASNPSSPSVTMHTSPVPSFGRFSVIPESILERQTQELTAIFPHLPQHELRSALRIHKSVSAAAAAVADILPDYMDNNDENTPNPSQETPDSASDILKEIRKKMKGTEKLKVDEEDMVSDVLHFYKDPSFDPTKGIRISLNGQLAIDTGGVMRQVFTDVFSQLSENKGGLTLFKGQAKNLVPVFSNLHVLTGIYEILGKMIAHSIIQNGPGFPCLAPVIYWYIASGDLQTAVLKASSLEVGDEHQPLATYIRKIRDANKEDLNSLNSDQDFIQLMSECGETRILTDTNKLDVVQSLFTFSFLTKNVSMLDQMRKGLSILGLLEEIEKNPDLFEHFFVYQGNRFTPAYVKELLTIKECDADGATVEDAARCTQFLFTFIESSNEQELSNLLQFITGTTETSSLLPRSVKVYFTNSDAIYSSTCLMEIKIPAYFKTQEEFDLAIKAVAKGNLFNSH